MIRYELYDEYGKKTYQELQEATDCSTIILEHNGKMYRPIHYVLDTEPAVAKCIPVKVVKCRGSTESASVYEQRS